MKPILDRAEIAEITGRKRKTAQVSWLRANKWRFDVNALGHPVIARSYVDARLGTAATASTATAPAWNRLRLVNGGKQ